jgi:hypothetical protein
VKIHRLGGEFNQGKFLLGFNNPSYLHPKNEVLEFKDKEGIDYSWWFGPEYCVQ